MGLKKWMRRVGGGSGQALTVQVLCLGILFALGMLGGYLYAGYCADSAQPALTEYLDGYCALYAQGIAGGVSLFAAVRLYYIWLLAAFLLGLLSAGVLLVPLLSGACGFLTMFAVSCFVRVYGRPGIFLALAAFGPRVLFTLPCFLWAGAYAWVCASVRAARFGPGGKRCAPAGYDGAYFYRLALCVVWLTIGVCFERYVTPSLFQWALERLG